MTYWRRNPFCSGLSCAVGDEGVEITLLENWAKKRAKNSNLRQIRLQGVLFSFLKMEVLYRIDSK